MDTKLSYLRLTGITGIVFRRISFQDDYPDEAMTTIASVYSRQLIFLPMIDASYIGCYCILWESTIISSSKVQFLLPLVTMKVEVISH